MKACWTSAIDAMGHLEHHILLVEVIEEVVIVLESWSAETIRQQCSVTPLTTFWDWSRPGWAWQHRPVATFLRALTLQVSPEQLKCSYSGDPKTLRTPSREPLQLHWQNLNLKSDVSQEIFSTRNWIAEWRSMYSFTQWMQVAQKSDRHYQTKFFSYSYHSWMPVEAYPGRRDRVLQSSNEIHR